MKLFVTGSGSFIGRRLFAHCKALGIETIGIDSAVITEAHSHQADIRDPAIADLIPEDSIVVHLAAISRDPDCRADPRSAFDINVNGTLNLAAAAEKRKARQFVFASSEWVYGDVSNKGVQLEDDPINVTTMKSEYALTKIVGEQCLRLTCKLPAVTILRFGIVYGPRPSNWSAVEALFHAVQEKELVSVGSLATGRRFIHVDDIVAGILKTVERTGFEIFNLSGNTIITLRDVVEQSMELLGRRPTLDEKNPTVISIRNPDNTKARKNLGWEPKIGLRDGLATLLPHSSNKS
ncbi:MAG: NAD(P)-dependent oxidoreductase [Candidatus Vogelbacteria bacterium]|nr:NAD(P)-dependent oxidoreductase [Candidatus Vogelbacteria bacterium]